MGNCHGMEGGVAILLLLVLAAVVGGFLVFFTGLGGSLSLRRRSEAGGDTGSRPEHTRPTTPYHEHTTIAGTEDEAQGSEEQRR